MSFEILEDGFSTTITFAEEAEVEFYEKEVTPPGLDGGGANDVTSHRNTRLRTKAPKKLLDFTPMQLTVFYDPKVLNKIMSMAQVNQLITVDHPDGSAWDFWGWLDKFTPGANVPGEPPTATVELIPSNRHEDTKAETLPVYRAA